MPHRLRRSRAQQAGVFPGGFVAPHSVLLIFALRAFSSSCSGE